MKIRSFEIFINPIFERLKIRKIKNRNFKNSVIANNIYIYFEVLIEFLFIRVIQSMRIIEIFERLKIRELENSKFKKLDNSEYKKFEEAVILNFIYIHFDFSIEFSFIRVIQSMRIIEIFQRLKIRELENSKF